MFKYYYSHLWEEEVEDHDIRHIAENILALREAIDFQINHPQAKQLDRWAGRYNVFFTILLDHELLSK